MSFLPVTENGEYVLAGMKPGSAEFGDIGAAAGTKTHGHDLSDAGQAQIFISGTVVVTRRVSTALYAPNLRVGGTAASESGSLQAVGAALAGATDSASTLQPSRAALAVIKY
ncbi:MAG: hypothetical protein WD405_05985 [Homoserinimonas sp.]